MSRTRRSGALALIERSEEFVIIQRSYWQEVSRWGLPGGSAQPNELPRRALSRLLAEKLGLRVTTGALLAVDHSPEWPGKFHEGVNYIYHVRAPDSAEIQVSEAGGYTEARWLTLDKIAELAIDHELLRIQQCIEALRSGSAKELLVGIPMI
ncbi:NUDIX hydrolase [Streptomyces sp. AK02-01A]|uniref:NUDIX hydrolase n=1 Tax=Streptomyces sp. AK02-01A TaxID=3028648 RepID=UPI0029A02ED6|nr:NUDIX domain-containing protein [Streptomyces sp. AK02-01A]MDX3851746.1 NUDIX domain-containing protein [Streptomyces sp. AK02-01A]